ncbi:putative membrane protein [Tenacibaculum sp. MAR_2010_89]|uniref:bestrophin family protein n=1 Tax=Tenacibaculum sp. MAR_2010_89 TaxID=1250198 RepID=UPI00089B915F|nr:bestrophin family ion channel [Tenacibaculum sp. MAR_2010_89]SED55686.1 putative membrane protein [Tenacibaculum sp. MAR_2010_89]
MYIKKTYPLKGMLKWTRRYTYVFLLLSTIPVFLFDILRWKWLYIPWLPLGVLGTAVSFIVSFKNNASYDRLWEARKIWGGIVNTSRSFTIMIKDFIKNDNISNSELKKIHRELVHRHVAWLTALRYQLRKHKPWENHIKPSKSNKEFREKNFVVLEQTIPIEKAINPYISNNEYKEIFAKGNQASQLLGIQSRRIKELQSEGLIDDFRHMELEKILVELYTLQGKSERIKNFPYPRQFATLNFIFIWIFIILLPYGMMQEFEALGDRILASLANHEFKTVIMHKIQEFIAIHFEWFSIPFSTLLAWIFYSMEAIGENSENPFEGGPNDVPISDLSRGIEIDIRQLIDDTDIPESYEWKNDITL